MIALVIFTDGRADCIVPSIAAAEAQLDGPITRRVIHDDSADPDYRAWLRSRFPQYVIVGQDHRAGFGGAIRYTWSLLASAAALTPERFVFHLEDDFVIHRPVDLVAMTEVLDHHPYLVQLALRRQPWNTAEREAGGVVESHPAQYLERCWGEAEWLEHHLFFTTNPSLYRMTLTQRGWPDGLLSEGVFTAQLRADPTLRFGYWGARESGEWSEHIGVERVGTDY